MHKRSTHPLMCLTYLCHSSCCNSVPAHSQVVSQAANTALSTKSHKLGAMHRSKGCIAGQRPTASAHHFKQLHIPQHTAHRLQLAAQSTIKHSCDAVQTQYCLCPAAAAVPPVHVQHAVLASSPHNACRDSALQLPCHPVAGFHYPNRTSCKPTPQQHSSLPAPNLREVRWPEAAC